MIFKTSKSGTDKTAKSPSVSSVSPRHGEIENYGQPSVSSVSACLEELQNLGVLDHRGRTRVPKAAGTRHRVAFFTSFPFPFGGSKVKKSEFATLISVTPRRLGQLIGEGSIVFKGKGRRREVDPLPSLVKLLEQAKTANANRDARAQLTHAQIRQQQLRAERQLKHWLSIDEVEMLVAPIYAHGCEAAQRESQQLYDKLAGKLSFGESAIVCENTRQAILGTFRGWNLGMQKFFRDVRGGVLHERSRLDKHLARLMTDEGQHHEAMQAPEANTQANAADAARRGA